MSSAVLMESADAPSPLSPPASSSSTSSPSSSSTSSSFSATTIMSLPIMAPVRFLCGILYSSPLCWCALLLLCLYLVERFDLGPHSFPWSGKDKTKWWWWLKGKSWSRLTAFFSSREYEQGQQVKQNSKDCVNGCLELANGASLCHQGDVLDDDAPIVPPKFRWFIRSKVIPTFRGQCMGADSSSNCGNFAMLAFSYADSLQDVHQHLVFKQITFSNRKSLVDPSRTSYPESYRLENYVVARATRDCHPAVSIARKIPALLAAFRKAERSHLRPPTPKTGILYCREMPCLECSRMLAQALSGVCKNETVLVYSQEGVESGKKNFQCLADAGISVVKIS